MDEVVYRGQWSSPSTVPAENEDMWDNFFYEIINISINAGPIYRFMGKEFCFFHAHVVCAELF